MNSTSSDDKGELTKRTAELATNRTRDMCEAKHHPTPPSPSYAVTDSVQVRRWTHPETLGERDSEVWRRQREQQKTGGKRELRAGWRRIGEHLIQSQQLDCWTAVRLSLPDEPPPRLALSHARAASLPRRLTWQPRGHGIASVAPSV